MSHAKLSPSKAYQWSSCTSSVALVEELIRTGRLPRDDAAGPAAQRGTLRHAKAADVLLGKDVELTTEERGSIMTYVNHCRRCTIPGRSTVYIEQRVPLIYSPEEHGTIDFASVNPKELTINDYKDGEGVEETAFENKQLAIYALSLIDYLTGLGVYEFPDDWPVTLCIVQPNYRGYEAPSAWRLTVGELRKFYSDKIASGVFEIEQGITEFRPDPEDACVFCRAKPFCKAYDAYLMKDIPELDVIKDELVPLPQTVLPPVDALTETQLSRIAEKGDEIVKLINAVKELLFDRLNAGEKVPGWKLVEGRAGNRDWTDADAAAKLLKNHLATDDLYVKELISPTKAEKLLKSVPDLSTRFKNKLDTLVSRSAGKPVLAKESDPRSALSLAARTADMPELPEVDPTLG